MPHRLVGCLHDIAQTRQDDNVLFIKSQLFGFHVNELLVYHHRPDDQHDGDGELNDNEYAPKTDVLRSGYKPSSQHTHRLERRQIKRRITPCCHPNDKGQAQKSRDKPGHLENIQAQAAADDGTKPGHRHEDENDR